VFTGCSVKIGNYTKKQKRSTQPYFTIQLIRKSIGVDRAINNLTYYNELVFYRKWSSILLYTIGLFLSFRKKEIWDKQEKIADDN
jgi:hypothetical protein